jgi:hypothetical protein
MLKKGMLTCVPVATVTVTLQQVQMQKGEQASG